MRTDVVWISLENSKYILKQRPKSWQPHSSLVDKHNYLSLWKLLWVRLHQPLRQGNLYPINIFRKQHLATWQVLTAMRDKNFEMERWSILMIQIFFQKTFRNFSNKTLCVAQTLKKAYTIEEIQAGSNSTCEIQFRRWLLEEWDLLWRNNQDNLYFCLCVDSVSPCSPSNLQNCICSPCKSQRFPLVSAFQVLGWKVCSSMSARKDFWVNIYFTFISLNYSFILKAYLFTVVE